MTPKLPMDFLRLLRYSACANNTELQHMEEGSGIPIVPVSNPAPLGAHLSAGPTQTDNSQWISMPVQLKKCSCSCHLPRFILVEEKQQKNHQVKRFALSKRPIPGHCGYVLPNGLSSHKPRIIWRKTKCTLEASIHSEMEPTLCSEIQSNVHAEVVAKVHTKLESMFNKQTDELMTRSAWPFSSNWLRTMPTWTKNA